MNPQNLKLTHSMSRLMLVLAAVLPAAAYAQPGPPKPRVQIIFDTSTSMKVGPNDPFNMPIDINTAGGDYDPLDPMQPPCVSKFCQAKEVVYNTLPQYATEARIGLGSYYQFLVKYTSPNTQTTKCFYDKQWVAGYTGIETEFRTPTDHTGSGVTLGTMSAMPVFPGGDLSGWGDLSGRCSDPANGAEKYTVTKTAANVAATYNCALYTYPAPATPLTLAMPYPSGSAGAANCGVAIPWTSAGMPAVQNRSGAAPGLYSVNYIGPAGNMCPMSVPLSGMVPMGGPSLTVAGAVTIGTAAGNWQGMGGGNECVGQACQMYSANSMYQQSTARQHWYSLQPTPFAPVMKPANMISEADVYGPIAYNGQIVNQPGPACIGGPLNNVVTYSNSASSWNTWGFTQANVAAQFGAPPVGSTDQTPGMANPPCSMNQPCTIKLVTETPVTGLWSAYNPINYDQPPENPAFEDIRARADLTNGGNHYRRWGSCAAITPAMPISSAAANDANHWLTTYVPSGCGTLRNQCQLKPAVPATTMMPNGCGSVTKYDNSGLPAPCPGIDGVLNAYNPVSVNTNINYTLTLPFGSMCPAMGAMRVGPDGPLSQCPAGYSCRVMNNPMASPGAADPSMTTVYNRTTPPGGYSGVPTTTTNLETQANCSANPAGGSQIAGCGWDMATPCLTGQFETSNAALCGGEPTPCTVNGLGLQNYGAAIDENQPKRCLYIRQTFGWTRNKVDCNLQITQKVYSVINPNMTVCQYDQQQYEISLKAPDTVNCVYSAPLARHHFDVVANRWCEYYRMKTVYTAQTYNYTYRYATKGGELVSYRSTAGGTDNVNALWVPADHYEQVNNQNLCGAAYSDVTGFPAGECPPTINNCDANPNHVCKLRWGAPLTGMPGLGRYGMATSRDSHMCLAKDSPANPMPTYTSTPTGASILAANSVTGGGSNQPGAPGNVVNGPITTSTTCQQDGAPAGAQYKLYSDWYDPGVSNGATPSGVATDVRLGAAPTGFVIADWNNQATKESGWGATGGAGGSFPGGLPAEHHVYVPIPDDSNATGGQAALQAALGKCIMPTTANVNSATLAWNRGGVCMAQSYFRNGPGTGYHATNPTEVKDFTPLNGALQNAKDYLTAMRDVDVDAECREYFVVLATDGLENTPANYAGEIVGPPSAATLVATVGQLKSHIPTLAPTNNQGIKTYVIGFGVSGAGTLDAMAAAGGTGSAFTASSQAALQTALSLVFNQITSGTFSRSKPSISTDGTRLYASHFQRGIGASASPEWKGFLTAYAINPSTGLLTQKWEYSDKLNVQLDSSRVIYTDVAGAEEPFTNTNMAIVAALSGDPGFAGLTMAPTNLTTAKVVDFVRNFDVPSATFQPYISSLTPVPTRSSRAGAIEHSSAVAVSRSTFASDWGGTSTGARAAYQTWQGTTSTRPTRIFVGSSDGLMRAIVDRADPLVYTACATDEADPLCPNGSEAWGWVPSELLPELYKTMMTNRKNVDNTLAISDVCGTISGPIGMKVSSDAVNCLSTEWFTVGIGTMRQGGRSVFGLKLKDDGTHQWLWNYTDADLGTTWSVPAIGRVKLSGQDHWAALFGGGIQCTTCGAAGDSFYALDALTGKEMAKWNNVGGSSDQLPARPAIFRRPLDAYLNSAVISSVRGNLYVARFENPGGTQYNNTGNWGPRRFFDPTRVQDRKNVNGIDTPIMTIVTNTMVSPPTYTLAQVTTGNLTLPLTIAIPPIYNRPKVATIYDSSGNTGDYYVGTGDAQNPSAPAWPTNFFYALHDRNVQSGAMGVPDDGTPLWVVRFPNNNEQVVSEPVVNQGDLVVATYIPPVSASACALAGDTTLYSFNPKTGALVPSIIIPSTMPGAGSKTSVLTLTNVGIPSDLLQIGGQLTFNTSSGGLQQVGHEPPQKGGDIRSFKRIR